MISQNPSDGNTIVPSADGNSDLGPVTFPQYSAFTIGVPMQLFLGTFVAILLGQAFLVPSGNAQWAARTPRDTVFVPANRLVSSSSHSFNPGVLVDMHFSGTYSCFTPKNGVGFDAKYTYSDASWNAPFPLLNPPSFGGTSYLIYTSIDSGLGASPLRTFETSYQPSHNYTARYKSIGSQFAFRINNRLDVRTDNFYYSQDSGGLNVFLAQFTAGCSIQYPTLQWGNQSIGSAVTQTDLIASYGIDPLTVDKVYIDGPAASSFSFTSQRGDNFTLPNESQNQFNITYSPVQTGFCLAYLHISFKNTLPTEPEKVIILNGNAVAPKLAIGPHNLDFGAVRVGTNPKLTFNIYNGGSAKLTITKVKEVPANSGFSISLANVPPNTYTVLPLSNAPIAVTFSPLTLGKYREVIYVSGVGVPDDSIIVTGEGAQPNLRVTSPNISFGAVRTGDTKSQFDTVINIGNWTANVTDVQLSGTDLSAFSFTPVGPFLLNPGVSREYHISFTPRANSDGTRQAQLIFSFDNNDSVRTINLVGFERQPRLHYDSSILDFGKVKVGYPSIKYVHATNESASPTSIRDVFQDSTGGVVWQTRPNASPRTIASGKDSVGVRFRPMSRGPLHNWLVLDAGVQVDSVYCFGIGAESKPAWSRDPLDFGVVPSDNTNHEGVWLKDTGDFAMNVVDAQIVGAEASLFTLRSPTFPFTIHENSLDSTSFNVAFYTSAHTGSEHHAWLKIFYDDGLSDSLYLKASEAQQYLYVSTPGIDFGKVHINTQSQKRAAKFYNGSRVALHVGKIWATPSGGPFYPSQTSTTVDAQSEDSITVTFLPTQVGPISGLFHADSSDIRDTTIPLTGIGAAAVPLVSDTLLDFKTVDIKAPAPPTLTFQLANNGNWPVTAIIIKTGDAYNEFSVSATQGPMVNSKLLDTAVDGASPRIYSVTFAPRKPALPDHEAVLEFRFDDNTIQRVRLIGKDSSSFLGLDSNAVNFGKVRIGSGPKYLGVNLINTNSISLQTSVNTFAVSPVPSAAFVASPIGSIVVPSRQIKPIQITFIPTGIGPFQSYLVGQGSFENDQADTVTLLGIGAAPSPKLSTPSLDFGNLLVGDAKTQSFTLTNIGNWPLVQSWTISGPNAADFTPMFSADTVLNENQTANWTVNFQATTAIQAAPRTATITFKEDDGTTYSLELIEHDRSPMGTQIGFSNSVARPGDVFYTYLRLKSAIPSTLNIQHLVGYVTYDSTVVDLLDLQPGTLDPAGAWSVTLPAVNQIHGSFSYDIKSTSVDQITQIGSLLMLKMQMRKNLAPGARSPLTNVSSYPGSREVQALSFNGVILLDSSCGNTHVTAGVTNANFVEQNTPNPFGDPSHPSTQIPFDVGADNTAVTLRIIDPTGREVLRPLDNQIFAHGHYAQTVEAKKIGLGIFYYEFRVGGGQPTVKKMIVQ